MLINRSHPDPGKREKNNIFTLLCGALKGFMKALKVFIKPFEIPQRSVKINLFFIQIQLSQMHWEVRVKIVKSFRVSTSKLTIQNTTKINLQTFCICTERILLVSFNLTYNKHQTIQTNKFSTKFFHLR